MRIGDAARLNAIRLMQQDQTCGIRERQRLKKNRVDHAEHRGVGADSERERQHQKRGLRRRLAKNSKREAGVVPDISGPTGAAHIIALFLNAQRGAELAGSGFPRFLFRHSAPHQFGARHVDMELKLFRQFGVCFVGMTQGAKTPPEISENVSSRH